jgi:hypothetical protein
MKSIMTINEPKVEQVIFSPCETYLMVYSPKNDNPYAVWNFMTLEKLESSIKLETKMLKPINGVSTVNSLLRSRMNTSQSNTPRKIPRSKKKKEKLSSRREKPEMKMLKSQFSQPKQSRASSLFTSSHP